MTITQIDTNIQQLVKNFQPDRFIYDFCAAFGIPKSTIKRLQTGPLNLSKIPGEVLLKKKFLFKVLNADELLPVMETIRTQEKIKHDPRFVILTDHKTLLAYDTKAKEELETSIKGLTKEYAFFLPLAGMEKTAYRDENPADVKAAEKMARLFDEIKKNNTVEDTESVHSLNVFLSRLLFCFFAEDTQIFTENQFTNAIASHTQEDGSDLEAYLTQLFEVLNLKKRPARLPEHLTAFPYVNGGLFREEHPVPVFSRKARKLLVECGGLDWAAINPDIFGSMIQAVVTPEHRGGLGMHYTSVPNIMKVIEPLFLNDLYEEFLKGKHSPAKLKALLNRLSSLKIFDPACGSGNFLIIAYKEMRKLENKIIQQLLLLKRAVAGFAPELLELIPKKQHRLAANYEVELFSRIGLHQFYGIELDDFAHEIAKLSLWLAEHQMNTLFTKAFGQNTPSLPLKETGNIVRGNATRVDWEEVCPKEEGKEVFILGNPPYLGSSMQSKEQKKELANICKGFKNYKNLDYIACWFIKGTNYIRQSTAQFAFVSTNSICQGEQVGLLWKYIFNEKIEISFTHKSFKWTNNAKGKAAVIVIIVGCRNISKKSKKIFELGRVSDVKNINPYLTTGNNIVLERRAKPLSELPLMVYGNKPTDNGSLILSEKERDKLILDFPSSINFIKEFLSGSDFLNGKKRWCLWIEDQEVKEAIKIPPIKKRLDEVKTFRLKSSATSTNDYAIFPNRFRQITYKPTPSIIIPLTTSERRKYIPFGFLNNVVVSNSASVIYFSKSWILGVISSIMHMVWVRTTAGRLKSDYRYSSALCYNNFPFPKISPSQKSTLETHVYAVLEQREKHSEKTLAQLYDPDKMPEGLRAAHHELDLAVERCYRKEPFTSDEERLAYLFKLYEKMIREEKDNETLFAEEKKKGKRKRKKV